MRVLALHSEKSLIQTCATARQVLPSPPPYNCASFVLLERPQLDSGSMCPPSSAVSSSLRVLLRPVHLTIHHHGGG